jgi:hypothetical protein
VKVATGTGTYATGNCTEAGGEKKYEWLPGPPPNNHFTIAAKSTTAPGVQFESAVAHNAVSCDSVVGSGEIASATTIANVRLVLNGCEGPDCHNATAGFEEVVIEHFGTGTLGVWKLGETPLKNKIGIDFSPVEVVFECGGLPVKFRGSVIAQVTANGMTALTKALTFLQHNGIQKPVSFVEGPIDVLEQKAGAGEWEQIGMLFKGAFTGEEKFEINSVV